MITNKIILPVESQLKKTLKTTVKELPSFPPAAVKIVEICRNESATTADLTKLVETDPGISTKVLGIVNSALYGMQRKITAINEAVVYLGFDEIKKLSVGVTVFDKMFKTGKAKGFNRIFFWRHCLCVAALSLAIAEKTGYPNPGEAYIAGLLHDVGKIFLDLQGRIDYGDFIKGLALSNEEPIDDERNVMGLGHDDLGAYYGSLWNLPEPLVLAIKCHHQPFLNLKFSHREELLIAIVCLADFFAWSQGMGSVDTVRAPILQPDVEKTIDINSLDIQAIISNMDREMENTSKFYNYEFPSSDQFRNNLLRANLNLSRMQSHNLNKSPAQAESGSAPELNESITTPHRSLDPNKIIPNTLKAIYRDYRFNRIYVMNIVTKHRNLQVVELLDNTQTCMDFKSVKITINKDSGGFLDSLRNRAPVIINGRSPGEITALNRFGIKEMLIVPFSVNNKLIGILGMDNIASNTPIQPAVIPSISHVAVELGVALENAKLYKEATGAPQRDTLTLLHNRKAIHGLLEKSFETVAAGQNELSIAMIDVDFFKRFNDQFGDQSGDDVLKLIATTLKMLSRSSDHVGRYGGDEFIVLLNNTGISDALLYGERIRREIMNIGKPFVRDIPGPSLTVSVGITTYKQGIKSQGELIKKAEKALLESKETGRNNVVAG